MLNTITKQRPIKVCIQWHRGAVRWRQRRQVEIFYSSVHFIWRYYSQDTYFYLIILSKIIYMHIINISHNKTPIVLRVFSTISRQFKSLVSLLFTANVVLRISLLLYHARLSPSHIINGMTFAILILKIRWHCTSDGFR